MKKYMALLWLFLLATTNVTSLLAGDVISNPFVGCIETGKEGKSVFFIDKINKGGRSHFFTNNITLDTLTDKGLKHQNISSNLTRVAEDCNATGSLSITGINPPEGTILEIGNTYTFELTVNYGLGTNTSGEIGVVANDSITYENLDDQIQQGTTVSIQSGTATVSVKTKISLNGQPVDGVRVWAALFPPGYSCTWIYDYIDYNTTSSHVYPSPTPSPVITLTPSPTPPSSQDMQARYTLDEGSGSLAGDSSGNGNHGIINGGTWVTGISGGALSFNGINDYIDLGNASSLQSSMISLSAWFKTTAASGKIIRKRLYGYCLEMISNGKIAFWIYNDAATKFLVTSPNDYNDDQWHHVVGVYDGSAVTLYIDGLQVASANAGTIFYGAGGIAIGRDGDYGGAYFKGLVDDVRFYNKDLSAQEVLDLYRQTSGLISHWKFDEGIGTTVADPIGGNNGVINNATWTAGKLGGGLNFDGIDDDVQIPGLLGQPQDITISAWANLSAKDTSGAELVSLGDHVAIRLDATTGGTRGFYYDGATWRTTSTGISSAGTGWHHFVYVVDDANNIQKIYVDGVEKGSTAYTQSISYAGLGSYTFIGRHGNSSGNYDFNGVIDDVRVYNRALSAQEIQDLYNTSSLSGTVAFHSSPDNNHDDDDKNFNTATTRVPPTATLSSFKARTDNGGSIILTWETVREDGVAGFNLYRSRRRNGTYAQVNKVPIDGKGDAVSGAIYSFVDIPSRPGTYYYKLETIDDKGVNTIHGHIKVKMRSGNNAVYRH